MVLQAGRTIEHALDEGSAPKVRPFDDSNSNHAICQQPKDPAWHT